MIDENVHKSGKIKKTTNQTLRQTVLASLFIALALLLPLLTGQIKQFGKALCPMHIPVLLCGYFCGPWFALIVGIISPILRSFLFGMPVLFPSGIAMSFELAGYGFTAAVLSKKLSKKKIYVYISLFCSMVSGRVIWGAVMAVLNGLGKANFGFEAFIGGAVLDAIPGIILQFILIPVLVITLDRYTYDKY